MGIDCVTPLELELNEFPRKYNLIGNGSVKIETNPANHSK